MYSVSGSGRQNKPINSAILCMQRADAYVKVAV